MAGNDLPKQLLNLIRDFEAEKSKGERRILNQKKRIEELHSEPVAANTEHEAKREKESMERELKGYEIELSMNEASIRTLEAWIAQLSKVLSQQEAYEVELSINETSIRTLEAWIALTHDQLSKMQSQLEALKSDESSAWSSVEEPTLDDVRAVSEGDMELQFRAPANANLLKQLLNLAWKFFRGKFRKITLKLMYNLMKESVKDMDTKRTYDPFLGAYVPHMDYEQQVEQLAEELYPMPEK